MAEREIEIVEFRDDPPNDAVLGIMVDIRGPFNEYSMVMVYFSEEFFREYFSVPWFKDLPKEERRIVKEKRQLFIDWTLIKIEDWIRVKSKEDKILIDYEKDGAWAEKVENGKIKHHMTKKKENVFIYK